MNHTHAAECYTCPEGWYCSAGNVVTQCPKGHYCPAGTGFDWEPCPPGTYNNQTGLAELSECKTCPGGWYCEDWALEDPSGECSPGFYCEYGIDRSEPTGGNETEIVNGTCILPGRQP